MKENTETIEERIARMARRTGMSPEWVASRIAEGLTDVKIKVLAFAELASRDEDGRPK